MDLDDHKQLASNRLTIAMDAHQRALARMAEIGKIQAEVAESMRPALEAINRMVNDPSFLAAIDSVTKASRVATQAAEAITKNIDISAWTRIFNTIDVRPLIAESLASQFSTLAIPLNWEEESAEDEGLEPLKEATEEVVSVIQGKITEANEDRRHAYHLVLKSDGTLVDRDYPDRRRLLSEGLHKIVVQLGVNPTPTGRLTIYGGYKNDSTTRRIIQKLNRFGFEMQLPTQIAVGEYGVGYRLAKCVKIHSEKKKENS